jgi:aminopeptidase N
VDCFFIFNTRQKLKMKRVFFASLFLCIATVQFSFAQKKEGPFTHADTLRGTVTPERAWWNVTHYNIHVTPDYEKKFIKGSNDIRFHVLQPGKIMQIDLQQPLNITSIIYNQKELKYTRDGNAFFIDFIEDLKAGSDESILINYEGNPREAVRPPWDGGWIFSKDQLGRPWMSVACEGLGASVWYPCKDYLGDEPDNGASLSITVPDTLIAIGNGRLKEKKNNNDGTATFTWAVVNPINNYNIIPYIGKYVTWHEDYNGEKGKLDCDYWVLDYNADKGKAHFVAVDSMLKAFEHWFGPYPFYEDGYKLIEAPHLGMEHQSAVAYGNNFGVGYRGKDLSKTGRGLNWDFIIVHESGHEWFGNSITCKDLADEWIHEGFTSFSETLYVTYWFGKQAGDEYNIGIRKNIVNKYPIVGKYGVNQGHFDTDEYYKASNMLQLIRQVVNDDEKFRQLLRGLNKEFYHQTVSTSQVENYINKNSGFDFSKLFDQYLRNTSIPVLEYKTGKDFISYRFTNCIKGFNVPVKINIGDRDVWIHPTDNWGKLSLKDSYDGKTFTIDPNFYIMSKKAE